MKEEDKGDASCRVWYGKLFSPFRLPSFFELNNKRRGKEIKIGGSV
jgi:hypothetical protein